MLNQVSIDMIKRVTKKGAKNEKNVHIVGYLRSFYLSRARFFSYVKKKYVVRIDTA